MTVKTPPLKWHGGKAYLARWILAQAPAHLCYSEPFFGGGQVLFARDTSRNPMAPLDEPLPAHRRGCSEFVNDLNGELTNFWRVLQNDDEFERFSRAVNAVPFSQVEFGDSLTVGAADSVGRAVRFFIRYRQSRQGLGKDFATMSRTRTRGRINEQANAWLSAVDGLRDAHERLRGVVIFNLDAVEFIRKVDGADVLHYCDPPYVHATRNATSAYVLEMNNADHIRLLDALATIAGKFILSGYPSDLYAKYADKHGWRIEDREIDNKSSGARTKERKTERLWMNF